MIDLVQTPHLLIGGATNSGKSVLVNSIICSILFRRSPDEVRLFLIDPKIVELKLYNGCPHLLTPVITDPKKAFQALQYCISEMERRYTLLDALGVRDLRSFNKKAKKERVQRLPVHRDRHRRVRRPDGHHGQGAGDPRSRAWPPWRAPWASTWCWPRSGPPST